MLRPRKRLVALSVAVAALTVSGTAASAVASTVATRPGGSRPAAENFFPVVREAASGLPGRTVYRPAGLTAVKDPAPVLIWQNGGCRPANTLFLSTITLVAARGFIVVADGAPEAPSNTATGTAHPERAIEVMDWLEKDRRARKQLGKDISRAKIAVTGQSCGGIEALIAGADPRIDSVISLNSGFFPTPAEGEPTLGYGRENLTNLHAPVLFVEGGPFDVAHDNAVANYELVTVPAAHVSNAQAGHALAFYGMRLDDAGKPKPDDGMVTILEEQVQVLVNWLDYTLNGNKSAGQYFIGACGLCAVPGWQVQTKNGL